MNYNLKINDVSLAALLIALGYKMKNYDVITGLDLNNGIKREKSASFSFNDISDLFRDYGSADNIVKLFQLPKRSQKCLNLCEYAKLAAHNYQVLKSVILENKVLKQIECDGYYMLKNDSLNADAINIDYSPCTLDTTDLDAIAIASALGCPIKMYNTTNDRLSVCMGYSKDYMSILAVESLLKEENSGPDNDFSPLYVLVAMFLNRKALMSGIYSNEKIVIQRGDGLVFFDKNAPEGLKERLLDEINRL